MGQRRRKRLYILLFSVLFALGFSKLTFAANIPSDRLRLTAPDAYGNIEFSVTNLFPGDAVTKDFTVKVKHKQPITLYYHADIRQGYEKLAEVMMVNVELPDKGITLYDDLMRDMPDALEHQLAANEKEVIYRITAYLDTSVGNEYQQQELVADFRWWYAEESDGGGGNSDGDGGHIDGDHGTVITPTKQEGEVVTDESESGENEESATDTWNEPSQQGQSGKPSNPRTGDENDLVMYMVLFIGSVIALILLLMMMRRKKGGRE